MYSDEIRGLLGTISEGDITFNRYDVRIVWDEISGHISDILNKDFSWLTLRPEDVYSQCILGQADIWAEKGSNIYEAFTITKIEICPYRLNKTLNILIAYSDLGGGLLATNFTPILDKIALTTGCSAIEYYTTSQEVADHGIKYGWDKRTIVCRKNLIRT